MMSKSRASEKKVNDQQLQSSDGVIASPQTHDNGEQTPPNLHLAKEFFNKIQTLGVALESDLLACDAKWTLFVAAALSYRYDSKLVPFPPRFAQEQSGYNIDALVSVINDTPKLKVILQNIVERNFEELGSEVVELLHWVLITSGEPSLRAVDREEVNILLQAVDEKEIRRWPTHVFEVNAAEGCHSDEQFRGKISELPVKLAFCGQTLDSYYSIIHNGFAFQKTPEEAISLSTDLLTALHAAPCGAAWGASQCGSLISCTALCEFAYDTVVDKITPNRRSKSCIDIELTDCNKMRLRYLFFYGSRFPHERKPHKRGLKAWVHRHKYGLSLMTYLMLLVSFGVANSGSGHSIKVYIAHKIENVLEFFKKVILA